MIALQHSYFHISSKFLFILCWFIRHKNDQGERDKWWKIYSFAHTNENLTFNWYKTFLKTTIEHEGIINELIYLALS
jgi:hypothetical protein